MELKWSFSVGVLCVSCLFGLFRLMVLLLVVDVYRY